MSDNAKKKVRLIIGTELAVIFCVVCIWLVKTATVGTTSTKATVLQQIENASPNTVNALLPFGNAYYKSENPEEAIQSYKEAIRTNPNDFDAHFNLGGCYSTLGYEEQAMKATKEAIRIRPDYAFAHIALGLNYCKLGRYDEAIETYKQAMTLEPSVADTAELLISNAYTASGRHEEANGGSL
ncbi:MAG TPA: tetratricopeptide repeat protein [Sedimentisphaerales bacterium]|nr:tetratricopeptide repeat protein [Sedimentisphaerales bacterium]